MILTAVRTAVRKGLGEIGRAAPHACDVVTDETLFWWPSLAMSRIVQQADDERIQQRLVNTLDVVAAKARETLEARWGDEPTTCQMIAMLCSPVACEIAGQWCESAEHRIQLRRAIAQVRSQIG